MDINAGLVLDQGIQPAQQCTAARKHDAAVDDVAGQLGRGAFQRILDGLHDAQQTFAHCIADLLRPNQNILGQAVHEVAALDLHAGLGVLRAGGADFDLDLLGRALTHQQVVFALDECDDALVKRIARTADAAAGHNARQADNSHLRRAAADVNDHAADCIGGGQAAADGGSHRFLNDRDLPRARLSGCLTHGAALDLGNAGRHADNDPGPGQQSAAAGLTDKALQHGGRNVKVGDDAVLERAHSHNGARRAADDCLGLMPDAAHPQLIAARIHGDNARLPHDDAAALHIDQCVGGTQINADVFGKHSVYSPEKACKKVADFSHTVPRLRGCTALLEFPQQLCRAVDRQPHNVVVASFDAGTPQRCMPLNCVGTRLIVGLRRAHIGEQIRFVNGRKMDDRCLHRCCRAAAAADADPGVDTMLPPGEGVQHPHRIGLVLWLAEHLSLTLDHRIKAADDVIGAFLGHSAGLGGGKRLGQLGRRIRRDLRFVKLAGDHGVFGRDKGHQLTAARTAGGKDQSHGVLPFSFIISRWVCRSVPK